MRTLEGRESGLAPFAFLWAFALLFHQVAYEAVFWSKLDTLLTLLALIVMLVPGRTALVGSLAAVHVATVYHHLPNVVNHWNFAALVSLSLFLASGSAWWRARRHPAQTAEELLPVAFVPAARWSLLVLYFLSGFHKLNADFFDPVVSCGLELYGRMSARLGGLPVPTGVEPLSMGLTVAVELGIPVLLFFPRLRRLGFGAGVVFHLAMAVAGYPRFSAAGVALLTLFLPPGFLRVSPLIRVLITAALLPGVALASTVGDTLFFGATVVLCFAMLGLTVSKRWGDEASRAAVPGRLSAPAMLGPALLVLSGIMPYLGLGTDRALSMYSNLRTEGGRSNHFLVPAGIQPYGYQKDLVQVLESSAPRLAGLATAGHVIPFAELRVRLTEEISASGAPVSVTYLRGGVRHQVPSADRDSALGLPVSRGRIKFMRFRAVEARGPRACGV